MSRNDSKPRQTAQCDDCDARVRLNKGGILGRHDFLAMLPIKQCPGSYTKNYRVLSVYTMRRRNVTEP